MEYLLNKRENLFISQVVPNPIRAVIKSAEKDKSDEGLNWTFVELLIIILEAGLIGMK